MGLQPSFVPQAPDVAAMLRRCDAAVIIGDKALKVSPEEYRMTDLAEAWIQWQGLPFVFALWACRSDRGLPSDVPAVFQEAKEYGLRCRAEIAATYSRVLELPEPFLYSYLFDNVDYDLAPRHIEGLEKFYSLACSQGLIPRLKPLRFLSAKAAVETTAL